MEIIDSHCHLDMEPFNEDRDAVIARSIEAQLFAKFGEAAARLEGLNARFAGGGS